VKVLRKSTKILSEYSRRSNGIQKNTPGIEAWPYRYSSLHASTVTKLQRSKLLVM